MIVVCKNCPKRRENCHADCQKYKIAKIAHEKQKEKRRKEVLSEMCNGSKYD
nr:MAG TPA: hypothetical protein [Caudoviricetes sp.]